MFGKIKEKLLDQIFEPLEKAMDEAMNSLFGGSLVEEEGKGTTSSPMITKDVSDTGIGGLLGGDKDGGEGGANGGGSIGNSIYDTLFGGDSEGGAGGMFSGITDAFGDGWDWLKGVWDGIKDWFSDLFGGDESEIEPGTTPDTPVYTADSAEALGEGDGIGAEAEPGTAAESPIFTTDATEAIEGTTGLGEEVSSAEAIQTDPAITTGFTNLQSAITSSLTGLKTTNTNGFTKLESTVTNSANRSSMEIKNSATSSINGLSEEVTRAIESSAEKISGAVSKISMKGGAGGGGGGGGLGGIMSMFGGGGGGGGIMSMFGSTGGMVTNKGIKPMSYFANGGFARGTDTVPAMLTPGEMILTEKQQGMMGGGGGVTINQTLNITEATDPQKFQQELVKNNKIVVGMVQQSYQKRGQMGPQGYGQ